MKEFKNILMIVLGIACDAFGIAAFVLPVNFLAGGVTGVGRVVTHYFGINISYVVGAISIGLLILGLVTLGIKFALTIVAGSVLFPVFLDLFNRSYFITHMTNNTVLCAVFGGVFIGLGLGLLIKAGASSGGSDVIPIILNRKFNIPVAPLMYVTDLIILMLQLPFAKVEDVLFGILVIFIYTITLNRVILIGSSDVQFTIISSKFNEINEELQSHIDVGSTLLHGKTGHLGESVDVIICIVAPKDVHKVKNTVLEIDPVAFMTTINVNDVKGRGFTMARKY